MRLGLAVTTIGVGHEAEAGEGDRAEVDEVEAGQAAADDKAAGATSRRNWRILS